MFSLFLDADSIKWLSCCFLSLSTLSTVGFFAATSHIQRNVFALVLFLETQSAECRLLHERFVLQRPHVKAFNFLVWERGETGGAWGSVFILTSWKRQIRPAATPPPAAGYLEFGNTRPLKSVRHERIYQAAVGSITSHRAAADSADEAVSTWDCERRSPVRQRMLRSAAEVDSGGVSIPVLYNFPPDKPNDVCRTCSSSPGVHKCSLHINASLAIIIQ